MRLATLGLALLASFALAVPAAADSDRRERKRTTKIERHHHDKSFRHHAPRHERRARVLAQAEELEWKTGRLVRRAERLAYTPDSIDRRALKRLRKLHREARQFRKSVDERRRLVATLDDLDELHRAFHRAKKHWRHLEPTRKQRRQMRSVAWSLDELTREYEPVIARIERRRWDLARY